MVKEKRIVSTATLIGPPPIPRKAAVIPSKSPVKDIKAGFFMLNFLTFKFTEAITNIIRAQRRDDCIPLTISGEELFASASENNLLPVKPPKTEPNAKSRTNFIFIGVLFLRCFAVEVIDIEKTAQDEKNATCIKG